MKGNYSSVQKLYKYLSRNFNEIVPFWEILDQNTIVQHFAKFWGAIVWIYLKFWRSIHWKH